MDLYKAPDGSFLYSSQDQLNKGQALCQPAHGFNELTLTLLQVRAFSASFQEPHIKENLSDQGSEKKSDIAQACTDINSNQKCPRVASFLG